MNRRLLGRLASVTAAAVLAGAASAGAAVAGPSAQIDDVTVSPGRVELSLTTSNLPEGFSLGSAPLRVEAGGQELSAELTVTDRTTRAPEAAQRSALLLLDTSGSMSDGDIAAARAAALDYARSLPADVAVGVITFADRPKLVVAPTTDRAELAAGLSGVRPGGNTALYDAVRLAVSTLDGEGGKQRLVVLSDGVDTASSTSLGRAVTLLDSHGIAADIVAFGEVSDDTSAFRQLAAPGGGRVLAATDVAELSDAFTAIARSFTEHAVITVQVPGTLAGTSVPLTVTVGTGAAALSTSTKVAFARAVLPPAADPPETGAITWLPQLSWQMWLLAGFIFGGILLSALLLLGLGRRDDSRKDVVDQIARYAEHRNAAPEKPAENPFARTAVTWTDEVLRSRGWDEKVAERLDLASIRMKPGEWTLLRICTAVVAAGVLMLVGLNVLIAILLGAILGWVGTALLVSVRISRRRAAFADQLPDVLQLVAGSLQSGFSLAQALDAVVRDGTEPAAGEISRALAETRIGVGLEDALDKVALRMASDDMKWIVMAIRIQREVGGNLAEVLLTTVSTMRERAQVRRQVRALSAEGRLSAYVLLGLPIGLAGFFLVARGDYMTPLYTTTFGWAIIACSVLFMIVGAFWMSRLVKVEV